ncbi:MAG: Sterol 3-beta-glucosyltransferase [Peltula sp. TS41687]|nr:MAG: Sterol 3-beta-glucosyltransferase [Peltula sp. TS41687]
MAWPSSLGVSALVLHESVKASLSPSSPVESTRSSPGPSHDYRRSSPEPHQRRSLDRDWKVLRPSLHRRRRSSSTTRQSRERSRDRFGSPLAKPEESLDSFDRSTDHELDGASIIYASDGIPVSASQILRRSDVFQAPTIQRFQQPGPTDSSDAHMDPLRRHSEEYSRSTTLPAEIWVQPPSRTQTQLSLTTTTDDARSANDTSTGDRARGRDRKRRPSYLQQSRSSPTLHELVKVGAYPLQRAAGFAGYLKNHSKRMSSLLATESMGYIEKVSGMWIGAGRHYNEPLELVPDGQLQELEDEEDIAGHCDRFRAHFGLPDTEKLQATYFGYLHRVLPLYGKIYISNRSFCFRSLLPGTRTKMTLPLRHIENVGKEKGFFYGYSGLVIVVRGREELFFEFRQTESRDDCAVMLHKSLESAGHLRESGSLGFEDKSAVEDANSEDQSSHDGRQSPSNEYESKLPETDDESSTPLESPALLFDDPRASILDFRPTETLRVTCLTIGSRGDVQPYIALCKGLIAEGHKAKIATHAEFEPWVRQHGIDFAPVDGDPAELMRICVEHGMFTYSFMKEATSKFRGWIDGLLSSAWKACQGSDILIESPSAMAGIHIAEALGIPYFRAFTMPWTRTRAYPHAFAVPEHKMGGTYNYLTYVMFDSFFWKAIAGQVNRWRKKELDLPRTSLHKLQADKVPFLYNFSPSVVPAPLDYSEWIRITGYWFLDEGSGWTPPETLLSFIQKAREDRKKIVYVGFGSIVVTDPTALTQTVIDSVRRADVRCILSKGWSDRLGSNDATRPEIPLPDEILQIKSAPHDWLFTQIDAAVHHGGAGTTGASLRAGIPTVIKPFFGDQFFFGSRVEDLGVGLCLKKLNVGVFSRALWEVTNSERMIIKAKVLGQRIRKEDGVANAIQSIYRDLEYAKTLIKKRGSSELDEALEDDNNVNDHDHDNEESWTFVGDDSADPEAVRQMMEWEPMVPTGHRGLRIASAFGRRCRRAVSPSTIAQQP